MVPNSLYDDGYYYFYCHYHVFTVIINMPIVSIVSINNHFVL